MSPSACLLPRGLTPYSLVVKKWSKKVSSKQLKVKEQLACRTAVITRWFDFVKSRMGLEAVSSLIFLCPTSFHSTIIKFSTLREVCEKTFAHILSHWDRRGGEGVQPNVFVSQVTKMSKCLTQIFFRFLWLITAHFVCKISKRYISQLYVNLLIVNRGSLFQFSWNLFVD